MKTILPTFIIGNITFMIMRITLGKELMTWVTLHEVLPLMVLLILLMVLMSSIKRRKDKEKMK